MVGLRAYYARYKDERENMLKELDGNFDDGQQQLIQHYEQDAESLTTGIQSCIRR